MPEGPNGMVEELLKTFIGSDLAPEVLDDDDSIEDDDTFDVDKATKVLKDQAIREKLLSDIEEREQANLKLSDEKTKTEKSDRLAALDSTLEKLLEKRDELAKTSLNDDNRAQINADLSLVLDKIADLRWDRKKLSDELAYYGQSDDDISSRLEEVSLTIEETLAKAEQLRALQPKAAKKAEQIAEELQVELELAEKELTRRNGQRTYEQTLKLSAERDAAEEMRQIDVALRNALVDEGASPKDLRELTNVILNVPMTEREHYADVLAKHEKRWAEQGEAILKAQTEKTGYADLYSDPRPGYGKPEAPADDPLPVDSGDNYGKVFIDRTPQEEVAMPLAGSTADQEDSPTFRSWP